MENAFRSMPDREPDAAEERMPLAVVDLHRLTNTLLLITKCVECRSAQYTLDDIQVCA